MSKKTDVIDAQTVVTEAPTTAALTTAATQALATTNDLRGKDQFDADDVQFPRIALAQKTSPQLEPNKPEYIDGLKLFQMFNSLSGENYGSGPLDLCVIRSSKRAMEFDAENKVVRFNVPLDDPALDFTVGADGKSIKPKATLFRDYLVLLVPSKRLAVLSFKGTQHAVAKRLNGLLMMSDGPAWQTLFRLTSGSKTRGPFTTAQYIINVAGETPADAQAVAEAWYAKSESFAARVHPEADGEAAVDDDAIPF